MTQFKEYLGEMQRLDELLSKDHPASKWIHDFVKSDNPRFAGKSKKERIKMALGAYYAKQHEDVEVDQEVEQIEEADLEESAAKFTATVAKAEAAFKKGNEKLGRHHLTNARSTMFAMKTTESPKITANGSYAKYKELHDRYGHMREDVEQSDTLLEYPSDLAKMKKADSYKVGDKIWTKVGGKWHKGHITTPLNKAGNHGVKFQHNGQTHSYVSSPDQLRLHVEGVVEEVEIEEAVKLGTKVKIHAPGKDYHEKVGYVGEIRHGLFKGAPKTYTVDYDHNSETGYFKSIQLDKKQVKLHKEEVEIEEASCDTAPPDRTQTFKQKSIWTAKNLKKALEVAKQDEPEKAE